MRAGGHKRKKNTIIAALSIGGSLILIMVAIYLYINSNFKADTEIELSDTAMEVMGMYSGAYEYSTISEIELKDSMPTILSRNNGIAVNEVKKGNFELEGLGLSRLYLTAEDGPYLYVKVNDFYVIINYEEDSRTTKLYEELKNRVGVK